MHPNALLDAATELIRAVLKLDQKALAAAFEENAAQAGH